MMIIEGQKDGSCGTAGCGCRNLLLGVKLGDEKGSYPLSFGASIHVFENRQNWNTLLGD